MHIAKKQIAPGAVTKLASCKSNGKTLQALDIPLCIDLDGTLTHGDLTVESVLMLLARSPLYLFYIPAWLIAGGKLRLKAEIAERGITISPHTLPWHQELLAWLQSERQSGRSLWLSTASHISLAHPVFEYWRSLFDGVIATESSTNLAGCGKAARLVDKFGSGCFDYCGNSSVDLAVWQEARAAIVVGGDRLAKAAERLCQVERVFAPPALPLGVLLHSLNLRAWWPNFLVFFPLLVVYLADMAIADPISSKLTKGILFFFALGTATSAVRIIASLFTISVDRANMSLQKRRSPVASSLLSVRQALLIVLVVLVSTLALSCLLPSYLALSIAVFVCMSLLVYAWPIWTGSTRVVVSLAGLYVLRLMAGDILAGWPLLSWINSIIAAW